MRGLVGSTCSETPSAFTAAMFAGIVTGSFAVLKSNGAQAQIRYWWLRNEPPNAPMKKLSASVYFCATCHSAMRIAAVEVAHDFAAGIAPRGEHVVRAAVDLHLVLIEAMHEIMQLVVESDVVAARIVERVRLIRMAARFLGRDLRRIRRIGQAVAADRRQLAERLAVAIELRRLRRGRAVETVRAGEIAEQMIEAAVLGVDHDDGLDLAEIDRAPARSAAEPGAAMPAATTVAPMDSESTRLCMRHPRKSSVGIGCAEGAGTRHATACIFQFDELPA